MNINTEYDKGYPFKLKNDHVTDNITFFRYSERDALSAILTSSKEKFLKLVVLIINW